MQRGLLLNADDFGRHSLINGAVEKGVAEGCLRSASLMPGEPCFSEAVALAKKYPQLGVGIHFTLVDGNPVSPAGEIPTLVTPEGKFLPNHTAFVKKYLQGGISLAEVRTELMAQLDKVLAAGITPTHADSHQHIHILPGIFPIVLDILEAHGIKRVRTPKVSGRPMDFFTGGLGQIIGRWGLWGISALGKWQAKGRGFATPDYFSGKVAGDAVDEATVLSIVEEMPAGVTEVMLHPGLSNTELVKYSGWEHDYEAEYAASCSPKLKALLDEKGIVPVNYADMER